jgi:hypothetical protein
MSLKISRPVGGMSGWYTQAAQIHMGTLATEDLIDVRRPSLTASCWGGSLSQYYEVVQRRWRLQAGLN